MTRPPRGAAPHASNRRYRIYGLLGALALRLWGRTWRIRREVPESVARLERENRVVYTFWHQHILPLAYVYRDTGSVVLVSESKDGEIISQVIHHLGMGTARGSSSRGGLRAVLEQARVGRDGWRLAVTPDGPRGPRHRLQPGVLLVAQRSGHSIVPLAAAARACRYLRSWDRFEIPLPFARLRVLAGEPIRLPPEVPPGELEERFAAQVTEALRALELRLESERAPSARGFAE